MLSSAGHSHCWTQWLNDPPINLSIKDSIVELQSTLPANHFTQFAFLSNCRAIAWYRDAQPGLGKYTVRFHRLPKELELWLSITRSLERTQRLKQWKIRRCAVYISSRRLRTQPLRSEETRACENRNSVDIYHSKWWQRTDSNVF